MSLSRAPPAAAMAAGTSGVPRPLEPVLLRRCGRPLRSVDSRRAPRLMVPAEPRAAAARAFGGGVAGLLSENGCRLVRRPAEDGLRRVASAHLPYSSMISSGMCGMPSIGSYHHQRASEIGARAVKAPQHIGLC